MKLYLACDPSITAWGFAVMGKTRSIYTSFVPTAKDKLKKHLYVADQDAERAREVFLKLCEVMQPFQGAGDTVFLISEAPTGSQSARSSKLLGVCLGLLVGLESYATEPLIFLTAGEIRKSLCGDRNASKAAVAQHADGYLTAIEITTDFPFLKSRVSERKSSIAEIEARGDALGVLAAAIKLGKIRL